MNDSGWFGQGGEEGEEEPFSIALRQMTGLSENAVNTIRLLLVGVGLLILMYLGLTL